MQKKNDAGFRNEAYEIAREFDSSGDYQLAEYIMSLLSNVNTFVPQMENHESAFSKNKYFCWEFALSGCNYARFVWYS